MTKLISEFKYNGLFVTERKLIKPREVTVLGVMLPVDPGMVVIQDGDKQRQVPTFVLDPAPQIDFGKLLTPEQLAVREVGGLLFGSGVNDEPKLLPLDQCPILPAIRKGQSIRCLDVPRETDLERGFAIYAGQEYMAANDSYQHEGREIVELVTNGDGEPCTHYPVRFFKVVKR